MVRHTDMEVMVILTDPWEQEAQHSLQVHMGMGWVSQKASRGSKGKM